MPSTADQPAPPPRPWRPMAAWTAGIVLVLGLVPSGCGPKHSGTPVEQASIPDPIDRLVARLNADTGYWLNGPFPSINLPDDALPETVLAKVYGRKFRVIEVRRVRLTSAGGDFWAALVDSNQRTAIVVLLTYLGDQNWWIHLFDVPVDAEAKR
jgi:hypothetical protein